MKILKREFNSGLFITAILLSIIGCMVIYSASNPLRYYNEIGMSFFKTRAFRQLIFILIGIFVSFIVFIMDKRFISSITWIIYPLNILLLIAVLVIGSVRMGAQRWISIGGFSFQPSEFCKITVILALAKYMQWDFENRKKLRYFINSCIIAGVPMLLIMKEPDLGTAMVLVPILYGMLFFTGANMYYIFGSILLGIASMPFFWMKLAQYQKDRILTFIKPDADPAGSGYTLLQSKVAIGSGGLWGKGWFHGTQTQLGFLPEKHTDFIFSVVGEEWGFVGATVLVFLFILLFAFAFSIAHNARTIYEKSMAVGLTLMIFSHVVINMAMTIGLMPITGLPLPFISYGGSSLVTSFITIGLLLNIGSRRYYFS